MLSAPVRAASLAGLLALTGVAVASPAQAAPAQPTTTKATITVDTIPVDVLEGLKVSGTCPTGSKTAAVTVMQDGSEVGGDAVPVAKDGTWRTSVDLWDAELRPATATVSCLNYPDEAPLATATTGSFTIDLPDFPYDEIEVGVTPRRVAIGGTVKVSATCPKGSTMGAVLAGNEKADDAFLVREVVPGANGRISETVSIVGDGEVEPQPGPGLVVVVCGDDSGSMSQLQGARKGAVRLLEAQEPITAAALQDMWPTAVGMAEFTILPAVVQPSLPTGPTKVVTTPARSAVPAADSSTATPDRLAMTGSDPAPLAAIGAVLLALGGAAIRRARRA